jgi:uncharacterized protein YjbI with pentapeptide repeats
VEEGYAMANAEHLARLKQGVKAWNEWRAANPTIEPDLREADLSAMRLRRANLSRADLFKANLTDADLHQADLEGALLVQTQFERANLRGCKI